MSLTLSLSLLILGIGSLTLAYFGVGQPNHYYQPVFAIWVLFLAYHRAWIHRPKKILEYVFPILNFAVLTLLLKVAIGGGHRFPFSWMKYPVLSLTKDSEKLLSIVPQAKLGWENTWLSSWDWDFTAIQTFLLLLTVVGGMMRFQPFTSLVALLLVFFSLPAFAEFNWPYVFPALLLGTTFFYLQKPLAAARTS